MNGDFISLEWEGDRANVRGDFRASNGQRVQLPAGRGGGLYSSWAWDGTTLEAETDPLGFSPLFYSAKGTDVRLSTSLLRLLAEGTDAALDDDAIGVFLRIGLFLGEETPFRHIRCLPPGGRLRWRAGAIEISGGCWVPPQQNVSRSAAIDGFIDLLSVAVQRTLGAVEGVPVVPLSGGRDSRDLLLTMQKLGHPPALCVTYNSGFTLEDREVRLARSIAAAAGVPHRTLPTVESRVRDQLRTFALTHLLSDEHTQMIPLRDAAADENWTLFDGIGGDVLTRNWDPDEEAGHLDCREGRFEVAAERMVLGHETVLGHRPEALFGEQEVERRFPRAEAISRIAATIRSFADAADPYSAFFFWTRTRREIALAPAGVLSSATGVLCPYLDPDLVEYTLALPFEVTESALFHDEALERAHPKFSWMPFDDEVTQTRGRPPLKQRFRAQPEGWGALTSLGPPALRKGLLTGLSRKAAKHSIERYEHYLMCVELASEPRGAERLLRLGY